MNESIEFGISMLCCGAPRTRRDRPSRSASTTCSPVSTSSSTGRAEHLISLAAAAAATERIKLLSGIALVPLYPPALLAKLIAMLDVISDGRYSFGIGIGGEFPKEFDAVGVPVKERGARTTRRSR